jgi:hypothetical protein
MPPERLLEMYAGPAWADVIVLYEDEVAEGSLMTDGENPHLALSEVLEDLTRSAGAAFHPVQVDEEGDRRLWVQSFRFLTLAEAAEFGVLVDAMFPTLVNVMLREDETDSYDGEDFNLAGQDLPSNVQRAAWSRATKAWEAVA